jgi:DHA1 family tetracycline resistance protein-like MFS transporter
MTSPAAPPASRTALAVLFAVVCINLIGFGIVVPLLPFFAGSLHAAPWQVALLFSAYSLGQFFAEPFWGRLSDRIGRKPVIAITTFCNAVGYIALALAPDIWTAVVVRLITGLGAGNISTVQGYIADITPPQQRAARMGLIGGAFGLGFIIGPALGGLLARPDLGALGYHIPLYAAAGLCALAGVGVLLFMRESLAKQDPAAKRVAFLGGVHEALANPVVSRVLLISFIYMGGFAGMEASFGLWAAHRFNWGAREAGWAFMMIGVVSATSQALIAGRLARRFGEARVLTVGMLLFGAGLICQVLSPTGLAMLPFMCMGAFGMSLAMPNISALISRSSPPDRQGAMLGLNMASGSAARILGPLLAGVMFSAVGPNAPYVVGGLLTIPAAIIAVRAGVAFRRMLSEREAAPAPAGPPR